jgi:Domain of unknown function (DUF2828)
MASSSKVEGMKGSDVYASSGSALLDLFTLLVRGGWSERLDALVRKSVEECETDTFVLAFQTRDIRGGKGERELFNQMLNVLYELRPQLTLRLLALVPEYGCWRDLFAMAERRPWSSERVLQLATQQLQKDKLAVSANPESSISFCAKWAPREGKDTVAAKELALSLFPAEPKLSSRLKHYRQLVACLNRHLETTEIKMCARRFADIEPSEVPGLCLKKHIKAFLNEPLHGRHGERHDTTDRRLCRSHFQSHFAAAARGEAKVNGAETRYPHDIIKSLVNQDCSFEERQALTAIWGDMIEKAKRLGGLSRTIAMCDFSGSMSSNINGDIPFWVSLSMGLMISELCPRGFTGSFLTFDSTPIFHEVVGEDIHARATTILNNMHMGQGLSTDFQKAMDLVLETLKASRCPSGDEPKDLIVITDMAWDQACGSSQSSQFTGNRYRHVVKTDPWQTHIQMIRESFRRAGEDMWGPGYGWKPPRIVIWNVAPTCADFHARQDTEGVIMLSGWSPTLLRVLMEEGPQIQKPMDGLKNLLNDKRYDAVREAIQKAR